MELGIASVAAITVICYLLGQLAKAAAVEGRWLPVLCGFAGGILGLLSLVLRVPDFPAADPLTACAVGIVSGLAATGANQIYKQMKS